MEQADLLLLKSKEDLDFIGHIR
uniref:Uncharacterized protein n=1 Tax=Arundo donax TaxID=35708 RepID=A0A0A9H1B7_ARUDO